MHAVNWVIGSVLLMTAAGAPLAAPSDADPTFGNQGRMTTPAQPALLHPGAPAIDRQGRLYVPVYGAPLDVGIGIPLPPVGAYAAILRLTADGVLDPTFGTGGALDLSAIPNFAPASIAVDEVRQRLIVGGSGDIGLGVPTTSTVIRIDFSGTLDATFGNAGLARPVTTGLIGEADALDLLDDGSVLVASSEGAMSVSRLLPDGSVDRTFGDNGRAGLISDGGQQAVAVVLHDAAGNIFVCGPRTSPGGVPGVEMPDSGVRVGRLTKDGMPVAGFGDEGSMEVDFDGRASCLDLRLHDSGAFSIAAATTGSVMICRFKADGSRDMAFNGTGLDSGPFQSPLGMVGKALDDGRLVLSRPGGAISVGGVDVVLISPPGEGGVEVSRVRGSSEMRNTTAAGSDDGGGGGAFDAAALAVLGLLALARKRADNRQRALREGHAA